MVGIIDYNMGNVGSIYNMLKKVGAKALITSDPDKLRAADKLILPGVGKFDMGIKNLRERNLDQLLEEEIKKGKLVLGICLGMQLVTLKSEEGAEKGLNFFNGETFHFSKLTPIFNEKVPHMGWNTVEERKSAVINRDLPTNSRFYFVHSYFVRPYDPQDVLMETSYGSYFCSAFQHDNLIGMQFHPEKSHSYGIKIFKNFIEM